MNMIIDIYDNIHIKINFFIVIFILALKFNDRINTNLNLNIQNIIHINLFIIICQ